MTRYNPYKEKAAALDREYETAAKSPEGEASSPLLPANQSATPPVLFPPTAETLPLTPPVAPSSSSPAALPAGPDAVTLAELADLKRQLETERAARAEESAQLRAMKKADEERQAEALINLDNIKLDSMDRNDAQQLAKTLHGVFRADLARQEAELTALKQELAERAQTQALDLETRRRQEVYDAVCREVPDFPELLKDRNFTEFLLRPGSALTNREDLQAAYGRGASGYIARIVGDWKNAGPSLDDVAQVGGVGGAPPRLPDTGKDDGIMSKDNQELLNLVKQGLVTKAEYRERLARLRAAH